VLPYRATSTWSPRRSSFAPLLVGLVLLGLGEGLLVCSTLGASPWTVLAQGLSRHLGLSIGTTTLLISWVVLLAWWPMGERPGMGTILNMIVAAAVLDLTVAYVTHPHTLWLRVVLVLIAVQCIALGTSLYLTTGLGPGPRDGLMTGLHLRLNISVVVVRLSIELVVLLVGWLLGGLVGVGTAIYAATIGFALGFNLSIIDRFSTHGQDRTRSA
jgi:uncharacterized protein